ncbi:outer membrane beta-barrel protein [Nibribacter ruber]|uniref:Outer membrane beta-barrel protein n=1 Tax=Nibribacter ruber TaxID=2698458 RepID=A0A6P1P0C0_9BACT|nr:porin family protein [Nibribacter ruber]QHL87741.1 outer membrane beta-barrel protein [Nibribacter ruber]
MKKIVLFVAAALSFSFANAQSGPRIGLKAGVTYSNLSGDLENEDLYKNKFGFTGGLTANFDLSGDGFLSLQPELLYSQKGYQYSDEKFTVTTPQGTYDYKLKGDMNFNYLELPVMLRVNAGGLFFEAGPQVAYLLSVKDNSELKINDQSYEDIEKRDKDQFSEIEIGYAAGVGYQLNNGLSLGVRYNGGINSLAKEDNDELTNARHSAVVATIGFTLPRK